VCLCAFCLERPSPKWPLWPGNSASLSIRLPVGAPKAQGLKRCSQRPCNTEGTRRVWQTDGRTHFSLLIVRFWCWRCCYCDIIQSVEVLYCPKGMSVDQQSQPILSADKIVQQKSSIILLSAFCCCASWCHMK